MVLFSGVKWRVIHADTENGLAQLATCSQSIVEHVVFQALKLALHGMVVQDALRRQLSRYA